MKIINLNKLSQESYQKLFLRSTNESDFAVVKKVEQIINRIKTGDSTQMKVSTYEFENATKNIDSEFKLAAEQAYENISSFQKIQKPQNTFPIEPIRGIKLWRRWTPVEKVGLYIPGGKALYPSSLLMTGIPAKIAGCQKIVICTPPDSNGDISKEVLYIANFLGIKDIFKIGGAEAITAMTFGTNSIPKVDKIFGAGGIYATTAKRLLSGKIAIDMPAGPSENLIIADESANPKFVAADLITDAEHGDDSAGVLITDSEFLAEQVNQEIEEQIKNLETKSRVLSSFKSFGFIGLVESMKKAIEFTNEYAPEHMQIMTKNPDVIAKKITNAGSVFLGNWTCKSAGDYATGANHVLPTGGYAKSYSALSVEAFGKWTEFQQCSQDGLKRVRETIEIFAQVEGLPAHKNSVNIRFNEVPANEEFGMIKPNLS